jgi:hypothetical protein
MEDQNNIGDPMSTPKPQQMISFIKGDLWGMTKRYFMEPVSGVQALSKNSSSAAPLQALTLMLVGVLLCHIGSYIVLGEVTKNIDIGDHLFLSVVSPLTFMLVMTTVSFGFKKATKHGGHFKEELTTGALYVFPIVLTVIFSIIFKSGIQNARGLDDAIVSNQIFGAVLVYVFLIMVNTLKQSMKASGVSEFLSWYLSPAGVFFGFYVTFKILQAIE